MQSYKSDAPFIGQLLHNEMTKTQLQRNYIATYNLTFWKSFESLQTWQHFLFVSFWLEITTFHQSNSITKIRYDMNFAILI